jgi:hypothetical protein
MTTSMPTAFALVGLHPGPHAGQHIGLANGYLVVGRGADCGLRLGDRRVSRKHAALTVHGDHAWLEDLGSAEGTFVNGQRVRGRRELRRGDVLKFAVVRMRYEGVGPPTGGAITSTGGNQYRYHKQRDSLLRDVAAGGTRGRRLVTFGVATFLVGLGVFAATLLSSVSPDAGAISSGSGLPSSIPIEPLVLGIPSGQLGWALSLIGLVLLVLGIMQHVVAGARLRRVDRDMPIRPSAPPYEPGRAR